MKFSNCPFFVSAVGGRYKNTNMANRTPSGTFMVVSDANRWREVVAFGFIVKEDEREVLWLWFLPP